MRKGILVTFEGIDGCGKTTLSKNLSAILKEKGLDVVLTKEPGGTSFGQQLRSILGKVEYKLSPKSEFLLFAADRADHVRNLIKPLLERKSLILCDRFSDSSLAYQGYGRGLDIDMINKINNWVLEEVSPSLIFYIRLDIETALKRIRLRKEELTKFEKEEIDFFQRVIAGYEEIFASRSNVVILDGKLSEHQLLEQALGFLKKLI